ncbi:hypothetical protein EIN_026840 [Entamoeba invadens IP1]|uniref:hypothetical protein n=1 Tax=Entamoeba invadens IP1 TaxID=370355 RepID=UPI0002C3E114|nr:hypothetical protein EIN_026840 [Entamoeba invadens IP1]ELP90805.1 hypothetical protein EIN_026840 [Entamoeba invadens IP1]|eukprot:XP_004257576.1 hypothetical protein EIN_026840 [Entamoeba invadens IP1]
MQKIFEYVFIGWSIVMGIMVTVTGALHFVYNTSGSFYIEGLKTNPTLAVILVAVSLMVMGLLTILYPLYYTFFKRESFVNSNWFFALWYFILSCLTFFITGVLGLVVGILCFITSVVLLVVLIILKIPNNSVAQQLTSENNSTNTTPQSTQDIVVLQTEMSQTTSENPSQNVQTEVVSQRQDDEI